MAVSGVPFIQAVPVTFKLKFLRQVILCIFTLFLASLTSANEVATRNTTLELVQLLFRHGDRSPVATYPSDKYQVSQWKYGWGELTDLGAQQAFDLGRYLRDHYLELNLRNLTDQQVFVRSTSVPRAIMTANCVMAGILKPDNVKSFNPRIETQAITVHHPPEEEDQLLSMAPCPQTDKLRTVWKNTSPVYAKYLKRYKDLFTNLQEHTGLQRINDMKVRGIADAVFCERSHNLTLDAWLSPNIVSELMAVFNELTAYEMPTQEIQQLAAGPLLEKMFKNIHEKIIKKDKMKIYVYSAHDTNVMSFLSALGVFNNLQPPYVSCVMVELHREDKTYYVKFLYRNDTMKPPHPLKIPGCEELCPIAALHKLLQNVTMEAEDRASVCGPAPGSTKVHENVVPIAIGGILVFAVVVGMVVYVVYRRRKKQNSESVNYRQLLQDSESNLLDSDDDELL